jgi:hypothetical protein
VSLLTDLDGFSTEYHCCGDLDGGVEGVRLLAESPRVILVAS